MFPVAISVGTYDRLLKLPYTWYGPELPWIRFRGRPLPEWAVLVTALPILWPILDVTIAVGSLTGWPAFRGAGWAIVHIAGTWLAASGIAGWVYRNLINTDRDAGWLAQTIWSETKRAAYAYGPLDTAAVYASAPLFAVVTWALTTTDWPLPLDLVLAAAATWPFGCWAISAFQPPERAERLAGERALRRGSAATIHMTGRPADVEAAEAA
jgi:hypothetical protein